MTPIIQPCGTGLISTRSPIRALAWGRDAQRFGIARLVASPTPPGCLPGCPPDEPGHRPWSMRRGVRAGRRHRRAPAASTSAVCRLDIDGQLAAPGRFRAKAAWDLRARRRARVTPSWGAVSRGLAGALPAWRTEEAVAARRRPASLRPPPARQPGRTPFGCSGQTRRPAGLGGLGSGDVGVREPAGDIVHAYS